MQCTVFLVNFTVGKKLLQSSYILSGKKRINCKVRPQYMRELTSFRTLMWQTLQFILHWFMKRIKRSYIKMYELCSIPNFECANFAVYTVSIISNHTCLHVLRLTLAYLFTITEKKDLNSIIHGCCYTCDILNKMSLSKKRSPKQSYLILHKKLSGHHLIYFVIGLHNKRCIRVQFCGNWLGAVSSLSTVTL